MTTSTRATFDAELLGEPVSYPTPRDYAAVHVETPRVSGIVRVIAMSTPDSLRWECDALTVNGVTYQGSDSQRLGEPVTLSRFALRRVGTYDEGSPAALRAVAGILPDVFAAALALPDFRRTQLVVAAYYADLDAERNAANAEHARVIAAEHEQDAALSRDAAAAYRAAADLIA